MEDIAFSISWSPVRDATGYQFQMATNSTFTSLVVNKTLPEAVFIPTTTVAQGTYYWRVKVLLAGRESPWSNVFQIKSETLPVSLAGAEGLLGAPPSQKRYVTPRIAWKLQHKDTSLLCLDGCQLTGPEAWNRPHTVRGTHGRNYCARASMSMLLSYYGGKISQDRLSYQMWRGAQAEGELGHDKTPPTWHSITDVLNWALGVDVGLEPPLVSLQWGKPTFAEIKSWVDANRPSITVFGNPNSSHARVMDGYFEIGTHQKIHLLDPWTRDTGAGQDKGWVNYADDNIIAYWVGPAGPGGAPKVKSDEATMQGDFDHDDILDFDEINRFHTDPTGDDSDLDLVKDKQEIQEYTFNAAGLHAHRNPDWDGTDGRKELDPDNDGGGLIDGCEAINGTDSFQRADDKVSSTTLIYPSGTINSSQPTYKWNAVCGAKSYWLQVDDSTRTLKIFQGFSANEVGCASWPGTCSVTPAISIAEGNANWWIVACHSLACGDWSNALGFIVNTGVDDPDIVGLWNSKDKYGEKFSFRIERQAGGGYEYVGKLVTLSPLLKNLGFKVGEVNNKFNKDKPGQFSGQELWRDSNGGVWWQSITVWIEGNNMLNSKKEVIATRG